jgi:uncharacterized protein YjbI with pentapeptide repeats
MKFTTLLFTCLLMPKLLLSLPMREIIDNEKNYENHLKNYDTVEKLDLKGKKVINNNFHKSTLKDCNFDHAMVRDIELSDALIEGGNYQQSTFSHAYMTETKIRLANFDLARFVGTKRHQLRMQNISIEQSAFKKILLRRANMSEAFLNSVDFSGSHLAHVNLKNATLDRVDFSNSQISNLSLKGAKLKKVNFTNARMGNVNIQGAQIWDEKSAKYRKLKVNDLATSGAICVGAKARFTGML